MAVQKLKRKPARKNFLRPVEVEECKKDLELQNRLMKARDFGLDVDVQEVWNSRKAVEKRLEQEPPDLNAEQRTKLAKKVQELEEQIKVGMLSHEEMRRNPPGSVQQNLRWQRANSKRITDWKNGLLALNKGMSQIDANEMLNVARLRPLSNRLNMDGAQIPAQRTMSFPSEAYKQGYDGIDWGHDEQPEFEPDVVEELEAAEG